MQSPHPGEFVGDEEEDVFGEAFMGVRQDSDSNSPASQDLSDLSLVFNLPNLSEARGDTGQ